MKNTLLFSVLIAGLALAGCNKSTRTSTAASDPTLTPDATTTATTATTTTSATGDTVGARMDRAGDRVADATRNGADNVRDAARDTGAAMRNAGNDMSARMTEWRLSNSDIEADIAGKRDIIRTRTSVGAPTGKLDKGTIEKAIKGRLNADPMLADLKFDANANAQGEVTLEGKVRSADQIGHAIAVALDTEGVTKVTSKIKMDADAGPNRR